MQGSEILFNRVSARTNRANFKDPDERGLRTADCTKYSTRDEAREGLHILHRTTVVFTLFFFFEDQIEKLGASRGGTLTAG